jgi:hypothetical protein
VLAAVGVVERRQSPSQPLPGSHEERLEELDLEDTVGNAIGAAFTITENLYTWWIGSIRDRVLVGKSCAGNNTSYSPGLDFPISRCRAICTNRGHGACHLWLFYRLLKFGAQSIRDLMHIDGTLQRLFVPALGALHKRDARDSKDTQGLPGLEERSKDWVSMPQHVFEIPLTF